LRRRAQRLLYGECHYPARGRRHRLCAQGRRRGREPLLIAAIEAGNGIASVPGAVSAAGEGRRPASCIRSTS
jgi:hypothetical protein